MLQRKVSLSFILVNTPLSVFPHTATVYATTEKVDASVK